ncbi:MAG TPA: EAL domain-containing response regulator [Methylotenera sp.]|nr:EAL domain-containing response regulator [Methylotenera sp.]
MQTKELSILVVEDDNFQRVMVINMLYSLGVASVYNACNGQQAIEMIRGQNEKLIDIIICDLNMPQMDGLELLRHLGNDYYNISIILVSALGGRLLSTAAKMAKMYNMKLLGAIEKPFSLREIKGLLASYERPENKWLRQENITPLCTLKDILQGIQAQEFEPYFQPQIDLKTDQLVGAEALARWIHPELGVISPYTFIPLLEQSGNIDGLTFLMLEKASVALRAFHAKGYTFSISVNLSLASLNDIALADKVTQIVQNTGLDPHYIILEITETAAMTDAAHALENLGRLYMKGFTLSIDDYGTGYSSMQQLTRIAFAELKIDQSFVKDLADNEAMRIVVESSIEMAHKLKVKSVAEGVETQKDWDMLKNLGCDTAQGYLIAKPMSLIEFTNFCEEGSTTIKSNSKIRL